MSRRCDPVTVVLLAFGLGALWWVLAVDPRTPRSGYLLYFGLGALVSLLGVRAAFWVQGSGAARDVARDLWLTPSGPAAWARGVLLPVQAAGIACIAPAVAWIAFVYPQYFSGFRMVVFLVLWTGFVVSALMDPIVAFGLLARAERPRLRAMQVALGLALLKPFPVMLFLDEAFNFGRGDGQRMIVAGMMLVGAHYWVMRVASRRFDALAQAWAEGLAE